MQLQMDKLDHCPLFKGTRAIISYEKNITAKQNFPQQQLLPGFGELGTKPSNKSIIEAAPPEGVGESPSNLATDDLLS